MPADKPVAKPTRAKRTPKVITKDATALTVRKAVTAYVMSIGIDAPEAQPIISSMKALIGNINGPVAE